ncbi:hypothetical protein [Priestia endophytica]|uniref:hypothetical protein n=1 Tax=Priestia endophytica TaxID=135735 RepID=UPI000F528398|nr:hypothetical protein [Priestia endophytica]RPK04747.1 hypothetical protein FH5_01985 [Priestia endophytica]
MMGTNSMVICMGELLIDFFCTDIGIDPSFVWMPAVLFVLAVVPMFFYGKYEEGEEHIRKELLEREVLI